MYRIRKKNKHHERHSGETGSWHTSHALAAAPAFQRAHSTIVEEVHSANEYHNSNTCTRTEGDYSTEFHRSRACACAQRTSAAARGEIALAGSWRLLAAAPAHFAHAVVTEIKIDRIINRYSHALVKKLEMVCIFHNVKGGARQRWPQVLVHVARWDELQINKHTNTVMMQPLW